MKERPILFSSPMVRALLAGTKTQTRRIAKEFAGKEGLDAILKRFPHQNGCPYGVPGDRLWVRETWARTNVFPGSEMVVYREGDNRTDYGGPWKPGIHMFRRDSRILLEITEVRVERLQDISEADSRAEGITDGGCTSCGEPEPCGCAAPAPSARDAYCHLWGQINGPDCWGANPWVWAVSFRKLA